MERNCILPCDLVEEILLRLPVKDLLRWKCVSKGWRTLIDDAGFIRKHYQVQYSIISLDDNMKYFMDKSNRFSPQEEFYLLSRQQGDVLTVPLTGDVRRDSEAVLPYRADGYRFECVGCVNGIICLTYNYIYGTRISFLALWNPATRDFKTIAYANRQGLMECGFGFDVSSNDFKILRVYYGVVMENQRCSYYEIYSLKTNSWKQIENTDPRADVTGWSSDFKDGYLNGAFYWICVCQECAYRSQEIECSLQYVIVSFNFTSEVFKISDLPKDAASLVWKNQAAIAFYKERLALVIIQGVQGKAFDIFHMWTATQFDDSGAPLSWEPVITMDPTVDLRPPPAILGLGFNTILMNGHLLLSFLYPCSHYPCETEDDECYDSEVYQYNLSTGKFKKFEFLGRAWFRYVESLYPLSKRLGQA